MDADGSSSAVGSMFGDSRSVANAAHWSSTPPSAEDLRRLLLEPFGSDTHSPLIIDQPPSRIMDRLFSDDSADLEDG